MNPKKIKEHLISDNVDYLLFVFPENKSLRAKEVLTIEGDENSIHILTPNNIVINLDKILYYKIVEKRIEKKPGFN
ncbi:hypothetical protein [Staphylococcus xylosus]|uniref:hypothetical protein n=1 Tax=Staphylococcus xylosus TaxID=1288 RepID=UPI003F57788D